MSSDALNVVTQTSSREESDSDMDEPIRNLPFKKRKQIQMQKKNARRTNVSY